ncbi:AsnC family transcriptional regulator [Streptomyces sp. HUAS MG91]|uniref:AsnC family transcriptional regulator n=1 Tax=Streptomyces tabacisoli TaxID=3156398 RepID=A0AAU8J3I5_9ACTN
MPVSEVLNEIDRQVLAALMVDGRAGWRTVAAALGKPERTVARRGARLLDSGMVEVRALTDPHRSEDADPFIVHGQCRPGAVWTTAAELARRQDCVTCYALSGPQHFYADIWCPGRRQAQLFLHELGATGGLAHLSVSPVLEYIRTLHDWEPGILTADQARAVRTTEPGPWPRFTERVALDRTDRAVVRAVTENGRATCEEIARQAGISEQTAARRLDRLRDSGLLVFRAVFDPALIGLPTAALLWIRPRPDRVESVAAALRAEPAVRYAALTLGAHQIVADVRLPSKDALRRLLLGAPWLAETDAVESSLILDVLKQSQVLNGALR